MRRKVKEDQYGEPIPPWAPDPNDKWSGSTQQWDPTSNQWPPWMAEDMEAKLNKERLKEDLLTHGLPLLLEYEAEIKRLTAEADDLERELRLLQGMKSDRFELERTYRELEAANARNDRLRIKLDSTQRELDLARTARTIEKPKTLLSVLAWLEDHFEYNASDGDRELFAQTVKNIEDMSNDVEDMNSDDEEVKLPPLPLQGRVVDMDD